MDVKRAVLDTLTILPNGSGKAFDAASVRITWNDQLELPSEPLGHCRVVDRPRLLERLVLLPVALLVIEELEPVAFELRDDVPF